MNYITDNNHDIHENINSNHLNESTKFSNLKNIPKSPKNMNVKNEQ